MSSPIRPPLTVTEVDGTPTGRPINKLVVSNGTLSISGTTATIVTGAGGGGGSGTVTSVGLTETGSALTITGSPITTSGTINIAGAGSSSQVIRGDLSLGTFTSGTVTSVGSSQAFITITNPTSTPSISIGNASGAATGVLTASDWTIFNNKQDALTLTTTGSSGAATLVGSTLNIPQYSGGGGSGTIGGSIASTQVARGASTADEIEGDNGLLFDGTSFTVNTLSGSDPVINMASTTKSLSLEVNTSQQLSVKGSANSFVFDASSATGGITFPDGTTQTSASGTVGGSGALQQVATWSSTSAITGSTNLTFDGSRLYTPILRTGGSVTTLGTTDLTIDTNAGTNSGSIVIADGVDGQISITPNGAGTIKLDGVELDNSAIATGKVLKATSATAAGWATESGGGGIGGSISDNQIAVGATTDDEIEGSSNLTFDGTILKFGSGAATSTLTSNGSQNLVLTTNTNAGFTEPYIQLNDSATGNISINSGNSGATKINIGRDTTRWVQINNNYYLPQSDGNANQFLKTNGSGTLSFSDVTPTFPLNGPDDSASAPNYSWTNASTSGLFRLTGSTIGISVAGTAAMYFQSSKIEANKNFEVLAGSAAAPSLSFAGDNNTGLFSAAADAIGFTVGGNERMRIVNNAIEGITFRVDGTDTAASPGFSFDPDNDTGMFSVTAATNTLSFSTGGTERLRIGSSGEILIGGTAAGTSGQVLTSGGASAAPTWETPSSGGSGLSATEGIPQIGLPTTGSNLLQFPLIPVYNSSTTNSNGVVSSTNTIGTLFQFFGHQTGDIQSLTCETFGASNKMQLAVYSVDSNNLPSTRVGDSAEWDTEADGIHTVDLSGLSSTISITKGDMYYLGIVIKEGTDRPNLRILNTIEGYSFNIPSNTSSSETMTVFNKSLQITGLTASTWPSSLTTANLTGVTNFVPNIGVVY